MPSRDYLPKNWGPFAAWIANFNAQIPNLAAKYGIDVATIAQLAKDNSWVQYWVEAKVTAKQQENQLTDYLSEIANGILGDPELSDPTWALPVTPPDIVPPGIKKRVREIANEIKAQKSIYSEADGELLGIVSTEDANAAEEDFTPELKVRPLPDFGIETDFRKYGMTALKVEARHKGESWQQVAFLTNSPSVFNIIPTDHNNAEQIEIRAVFIKDNSAYGNYSAIYTVSIAP